MHNPHEVFDKKNLSRIATLESSAATPLRRTPVVASDNTWSFVGDTSVHLGVEEPLRTSLEPVLFHTAIFSDVA